MWEHEKSWLSLILGLVLLVLGGIPLLNSIGLIGFNLPAFLLGLTPQVLLYIIAAGGVYLIVDVFGEWGEWYGYASLALGVVAILAGLVPLLFVFGIIPWTIPGMSLWVYNIIFVIEAFFLIIGAFLQ
ncbi:hypothetical protein HY641_03175 [Candidatus Woesearchaeota archaeon]|nr:hypothetical protein [Candidatus Woesearchaeota archaeon]